MYIEQCQSGCFEVAVSHPTVSCAGLRGRPSMPWVSGKSAWGQAWVSTDGSSLASCRNCERSRKQPHDALVERLLLCVSLSLPPSQEVESAGEGEAKARVVEGSSDSSAGDGAWLANAARLLGLKEDALTRKVMASNAGTSPPPSSHPWLGQQHPRPTPYRTGIETTVAERDGVIIFGRLPRCPTASCAVTVG